MCLNPVIINNRKYINLQNQYPCVHVFDRDMYYTRPSAEPYNYKYFNRRNLGVCHDNIDRFYAFNPVTGEQVPLFIEVPCGKCLECRHSRTVQINNRMLCEQIGHGCIKPLFFTLTYNDENLPKDGSVNKLDVRLFINRLYTYLRREGYQGSSPRHIVFSEYSPEKLRPHYHGLIFGLDVFQLWPRYLDFVEWFEKIWGKGFINIKHFEPHGFKYVSKYLLKEKFNPGNLAPNFWFGSRVGGGIGSFALHNPDFVDAVRSNFSTFRFKFNILGEVHTVTVPKYLRDKVYSTASRLLPKVVRDAVFNLCFGMHKAQLKLLDCPWLSSLEKYAYEFPVDLQTSYPYFRWVYDIDTCPDPDTLRDFVLAESADSIIEQITSSEKIVRDFISCPAYAVYCEHLLNYDRVMCRFKENVERYVRSLPPAEDRLALLLKELREVKSRNHYCG